MPAVPPPLTDWIEMDDGSHVRLDPEGEVVADVFLSDDDDWCWAITVGESPNVAFVVDGPERGRVEADAALLAARPT